MKSEDFYYTTEDEREAIQFSANHRSRSNSILEILEADLDLNLAHYDRGTYPNIEEREKGGRSSVSVE